MSCCGRTPGIGNEKVDQEEIMRVTDRLGVAAVVRTGTVVDLRESERGREGGRAQLFDKKRKR